MSLIRVLVVLLCWGVAGRAQSDDRPPLSVKIGGIRLQPGGFFDLIGSFRSASPADGITTHFGAIPLTETPSESRTSAGHSRLLLRANSVRGPVQLTAYVEGDFLNPNPGQTPYRWRQAWGAARWGRWEVTGGRAWSLLRSNRTGVQSDKGLMTTLVVEPAYHVGLVGARTQQFRLGCTMGDYHAVVAWETRGALLLKTTVDKKFGHTELTAFTGRYSQRGVSAAATLKLGKSVRFVTQEYWSKHAADQALSIVPARLSGGAALEGVEISAARRLELYSYAGWVYAARWAGNRVVREYSVGGDYRVPVPAIRGVATFSLQGARMDRALWVGQYGLVYAAMYRLRYTFNP